MPRSSLTLPAPSPLQTEFFILSYLLLVLIPFSTSTTTPMDYLYKPRTPFPRRSKVVGRTPLLNVTQALSNNLFVSVTQRMFRSISVSLLTSLSCAHSQHPALVNMVEVPLIVIYLPSKHGTSHTISSGRAVHVCDMYSMASQTKHLVALDSCHVPQSTPR